MSEWTECSIKCKEGTQTRMAIQEPLNGGKPCGELIQKCKIPCKTLQEQYENKFFDLNELDLNNKIIFYLIIILILIITIFIIKFNKTKKVMR